MHENMYEIDIKEEYLAYMEKFAIDLIMCEVFENYYFNYDISNCK